MRISDWSSDVCSSDLGLEGTALSELIDRLKGRAGIRAIYRYLPDEHHWPERSFKEAASIAEQPSTFWKSDRPRPTRLLASPESIRSAEHTSELQSLMRLSSVVFCL